MRRAVVCGVHWNGDPPASARFGRSDHTTFGRIRPKVIQSFENRINGAFAIGSDDLDAMIQVVSERAPDVGSVRVGIRPQCYLCEHFIRHFDLSIFAN
jgi:hypothetical protein